MKRAATNIGHRNDEGREKILECDMNFERPLNVLFLWVFDSAGMGGFFLTHRMEIVKQDIEKPVDLE